VSPGRIQARGELEQLKFLTARCCREALDTARAAAEDAGEDGERFENAILELVIDDDPIGENISRCLGVRMINGEGVRS
jgi:hypothetical protein